MAPSAAALPRCPVCNSVVPATRTACVSCGMEVSKMEDYRKAAAAAAKRAGKTNGSGRAAISTVRAGGGEERSGGSGRVIKRVVGVLVVILVLSLAVYFIMWLFAKPLPWKALPTDQKAAVENYVNLVGDDEAAGDASHKKAYTLIAASSKDPDDKNEPDLFLGYHHDVYRYLWSITGDPKWQESAKIEPDAKQANTFVVTVGPEVMHVQVVDESPVDVGARGEHHWAVTPFLEIDPRSPGRTGSGPNEAAVGGLRMLGAGGSERTIRGIIGMGGRAHESVMDKKMKILPLLNQPRSGDLDRMVILLWSIRTDPTVKWRLEEISKDERYEPSVRLRAKQVLDGSLSEEDRAAAGVND